MPSPRTGKAGSAVDPAQPRKPDAADKADPGEVERVKAGQRQSQSGKYGTVEATPHKPAADGPPDPEQAHWIEIELVDDNDKPVSGAAYRVTLPNGQSVAEGTLDEKGFARVEGLVAGTCQVTFPKLDQRDWEKI